MKINYARNLPHIQPIGATFFITFSLYGSIPKEKIQQLQQERNAKISTIREENSGNLKENLDIAQKRYFQRVDAVLDSVEYGQKYLSNVQVAQIVANKIHQYDNEYYVSHWRDFSFTYIRENYQYLLP